MLLNIEIDGGKYTLIQNDDGSGEILRYGEKWMSPLCGVNGSKMILAMGYEIERLREEVNTKLHLPDREDVIASQAIEIESYRDKFDRIREMFQSVFNGDENDLDFAFSQILEVCNE